MLTAYEESELCMGTAVSIKAVSSAAEPAVRQQIAEAFRYFREVETVCSRFDPQSELSRLSRRIGQSVPLSPILFETLRFALAVAETSGGRFDPTIGFQLEKHGFNRHYLTGETVSSADRNQAQNQTNEQQAAAGAPVSFRDISIDEDNRTVCLNQPMRLDLGAVAKGFAVDLAAGPLSGCEGFLINAGGDIYAAGVNEQSRTWRIGIQHPFEKTQTVGSVQITRGAVCTSGSYERPSPLSDHTHHLIEPESGQSPQEVVSCTVISSFAMMADAFSTAAFIMGPQEGAALLNQMDLQGLWISKDLTVKRTPGMEPYQWEPHP